MIQNIDDVLKDINENIKNEKIVKNTTKNLMKGVRRTEKNE